jgi:hypothetical protein
LISRHPRGSLGSTDFTSTPIDCGIEDKPAFGREPCCNVVSCKKAKPTSPEQMTTQAWARNLT